MIRRLSSTMAALTCVLMSGTTFAKGTTVQVTVTGPGLEAPLHISNAEVTSANVWGGNFADWDAGSVEISSVYPEPFLLHFWVQFGPGDIQMKYVLRYQWHKESDRAIVCLPGRRDIWYRTNVFSILREGLDGSCFYAAKEWGSAVRAALR